jgi:FtsP/CotA-like multicopper oxidase with cupredoxin domain
MDGHPRDEVAAGESYQIRFPVRQRASTCWYHAHTDQLTAEQAYAGVAGFFIIEDPAEAAFGLPSGSHEVPLVFTDKRVSASRQWVYAPSMMDVMSGYLGDVMLVNGTPDAWQRAVFQHGADRLQCSVRRRGDLGIPEHRH